MSTPEPVLITVSSGVAHIVLNRPEAANAFDLPAAHAFAAVVERCAADDVRAVVITGAGTRFCAGGDVTSFLASDDPRGYLHDLATTLEAALRRLGELPKPVLAGVHGAVAGAGLAFVLTADLVIAAPGTKFTMAYSGIGLTPDCGVSYLLPRVIGLRRALEITLGNRIVTTDEARDWGLISDVAAHPAQDALERARTICDGPAGALGQARRLLRTAYDVDRDTHARDEVSTIAAAITTDEAEALVARFTSRSAREAELRQ